MPPDGGAENVGPMMSSFREKKRITGKCGTENGRIENAGAGKCQTWNTLFLAELSELYLDSFMFVFVYFVFI